MVFNVGFFFSWIIPKSVTVVNQEKKLKKCYCFFSLETKKKDDIFFVVVVVFRVSIYLSLSFLIVVYRQPRKQKNTRMTRTHTQRERDGERISNSESFKKKKELWKLL